VSVDRSRFPADEWALIEHGAGDELSQTLFAVANGTVGLRPGSGQAFVNGFHETFRIHHAETAYGLARVGQVIWPVPDATVFQVRCGGLDLGECPLVSRVRRLDFRLGETVQTDVRQLPDGAHVTVVQTWLVSLARPGMALTTVAVTGVPAGAAVAIEGELRPYQPAEGAADDPRRADLPLGGGLDRLDRLDRPGEAGTGGITMGAYRCRNSRLTVAAGYLDRVSEGALERVIAYATTPFEPVGLPGGGLDVVTDQHPAPLLAACRAELAGAPSAAELRDEQAAWLVGFWDRADVRVQLEAGGQAQVGLQQAIRWELFQLAQAGAQLGGFGGIPAKGLSGWGYSGHCFWDQELYILPFLIYTDPARARQVLEFRHRMLPAARARAAELELRGALYPWRTINGEEASAYFPAGTAQYHIDAGVAYAVQQYYTVTGDAEFMAQAGGEILVETARMWADLGFWGDDGLFHIHTVTGPDEYSAIVDDNFYTNAMARHNLLAAAPWGTEAEVAEWRSMAAGMYLGYDAVVGVHAQDSQFLRREPWPAADTRRPLLLHHHPLVIYRHQVVKQADVVLALHLLGHEFSLADKRADFDYYDPLTTGDSTLSAATQAIVAAEVGRSQSALEHFAEALFVDLADRHGNTADGVHLASAGGVWLALVAGFGGLRDGGGEVVLEPHLPPGWAALEFSLQVGGELRRYCFKAEAAGR
jgi:alpha,alpha-trehalose phosphorylase